MGPVLIQLPRTISFNRPVTEYFYNQLKEKYSDYDFAMEVRHPSWMTDESYELMARYKIIFVMSHSGNHFPYEEVITSKKIYFRFHGPGSLYNSKYEDAQLKKYAKLFTKWICERRELWIFFNNDWFGYGIDNALMLRNFIGKLIQQVPAG
jgi:uncharacterized protein YecE (DUF72 family)